MSEKRKEKKNRSPIKGRATWKLASTLVETGTSVKKRRRASWGAEPDEGGTVWLNKGAAGKKGKKKKKGYKVLGGLGKENIMLALSQRRMKLVKGEGDKIRSQGGEEGEQITR